MSLYTWYPVLMAKFPQPGRVKTRLMPELTAEQAAAVHSVFLKHWAHRLQPDFVLCHDPPDCQAGFFSLLGLELRYDLLAQSSGSLGDRIAAAARRFQENEDRDLLFVGVDSPDLPQSHWENARDLLMRTTGVLAGPTDDGGFWCLGVHSAFSHLLVDLLDLDWSSGREYQQLRDNAASLGLSFTPADLWYDVDRAADLRRLIRNLQQTGNPFPSLLAELRAVLPPDWFC